MDYGKPKKDIQITIRLTSDLHDKIVQESQEQKRERTNMITVILESYFEDKEKFKKIAEKK